MKAVPAAPVLGFGGACALMLALGACADNAGFPSLARRPAEIASGEPTPVASSSAVPSEASAATLAKLAELRQTAGAAHTRFASRQTVAERAAAGAGPLGSESWAAASVALATLEDAHDQQTAALTELDQLQVERQVADAGAADADTTAIMTARDAIATAADGDGEVVNRLRERLGR